ncbi:uncharacterized protein LOC131892904 isoform X2 [Tigriopus californicus]|uniref:uncharacterized protein LOC131892904 isoform X2 n=1 Tax=Tigriopus californicus TaxID=6832 RepID=UPI0027DA2A37|nr:uncharacterized protein LOC131892904 isoform X2 [Tigriopus californicus]
MLPVIPSLESALRQVILAKQAKRTLTLPVDVLQELNAHWEQDQDTQPMDPDPADSAQPHQTTLTFLLERVMPIWARQIQNLRLCGQPMAHPFRLTLAGSPRTRPYLPVHLAWFDLCEWLHLIEIDLAILVDLDAVSNQLGGLVLTRCRPPTRHWSAWWSRFSWDNLHTLSLGRNQLTQIDWPLDGVCPNLHQLDLSYNQLSSFKSGLQLPRLRVLIASFNQWRTCPDLSGLPQLQTLHLAYNFLERLDGLEMALQLRVLDISANLLLHHDTLSPLSRLRWLRSLDLNDNPLGCLPTHRESTLAWISPHVDTEAFVLDRGALSPSDKLRLGLARQLTVAGPTQPRSRDPSPVDRDSTRVQSGHRSGTRARSRQREVVIAEPSHEIQEPTQSFLDNPIEEEEPEYLQTKRKVDALRATHGQAGWLHSVGGQELNNVLGISRASRAVAHTTLTDESLKEQEAKRQDIEKFVEQASEQLRRTKCSEPVERLRIMARACVEPNAVEDQSEDEAMLERTVIPRLEQATVTPSAEDGPAPTSEKSASSQLDDSDELPTSFYSKYIDNDDDIVPMPRGPTLVVPVVQVDNEDVGEVDLDLSCDFVKLLNQLKDLLWQKSTHLLINVEIVKTEPPTLEFTFRADGSLACMEPLERYRFILNEVDLSKVLDFVQPTLADHRLAMARAVRRMNCLMCQNAFKLEINQPMACPKCSSAMVVQGSDRASTSSSSPTVSVGIPVCEDLAFATPKGESPNFPSTLDDQFCRSTPQKRANPVYNVEVASPEYFGDHTVRPINAQNGSSNSSEESNSNQRLNVGSVRREMDDTSSLTSAAYYTCASDISLNSAAQLMGGKVPRTRSTCTTPKVSKKKRNRLKKVASEGVILGKLDTFERVSPIPREKHPPSFDSVLSETILHQLGECLYPRLIAWDYHDFTLVDHRVKLHCELVLCQERDENILLLAKGFIKVPSLGNMFRGVFVFSNRNLFILRCPIIETEDVDEWLISIETRPIQQLRKSLLLARGQGIGLEFTKPNATYYLIFGDPARTSRFKTQLDDYLREFVRPSGLEHRDISSLEEGVILDQMDKNQVQCNKSLVCILDAQTGDRHQADISLKHSTVILTRFEVILIENFFQWIFADNQSALRVDHVFRLQDMKQINLHKSRPEVLSLLFGETDGVHLFLASESMVLDFVKKLQELWEDIHDQRFEECLNYYLGDGTDEVVNMCTFQLKDSIEPNTFDLTEWIHVVKRSAAQPNRSAFVIPQQ